ncbi:MAG: SRPBCC domain-containing protein, partial [Chitinophagaceae bacterium]|nr:SRPBCC domain-containing protein [Chitinophagaceae bacterium]
MTITVQTIVKKSIEHCWRLWTTPADILQFNNPFEDWHTAKVEMDLRPGGRFY